MSNPDVQRIRTALLFIVTGSLVEIFCVSDLHPATFLVFALVGVPLILVGIGLFIRMVWAGLWRKEEG